MLKSFFGRNSATYEYDLIDFKYRPHVVFHFWGGCFLRASYTADFLGCHVDQYRGS